MLMDRPDESHDPRRSPETLEDDLAGLVEQARQQASEDPFRNPVLTVALAISRRMDRGEVTEADLDGLFGSLRLKALEERAARLRAYVGLDEGGSNEEGLNEGGLDESAGDDLDAAVPL